MSPLMIFTLAAAGFVGTHFLLSHPLRAGLVAKLGERGFSALYSVLAIILFVAMVKLYPAADEKPARWAVGETGWIVASLLMWLGSILLVGSLRRNPAFPRPGAPPARIDPPKGVFAITRHPMNWAFASWAIVHLIVNSTDAGVVLSAAILILAIGGSVGQDAKKLRLLGDQWRDWMAQTSFVPFGRGLALPDAFALVGGTLLFLIASWAHAVAVGPWRWLG